MDFSFKIFEKQTNKISEKHRCYGNFTNISKAQAIRQAEALINNIGKETYYAIIYSFDWKKGYKAIGTINYSA